MIFAAAIAAAAALIGAAISANQQDKANAIRAQLAQQFQNVPLPTIDKMIAQKLPPESAAAYTKVTQASQAQGDVLGKYMGEVNAQGETADDRASYMRMQNAAAGSGNSAQGAVERNMATRGLGGSGMSFALQQQGAQGAINAANSSGVQEAADARGRYMSALQGAGQLAGQIRGQDTEALKAQDAINEFNARQQQDADQRNQMIPQQNYDNAMSKQTAVANEGNGVAAGYERGAGQTMQTAGGIGQAAITAGAAYDQYGNPIKKKGYQDSAGSDSDPSGGEW